MMAAARIGPERMAALLRNKFCHTCPVHYYETGHKNQCIYFCLDCEGLQQEALCYHCRRLDHESHHMLQVRRASLSEVVRVEDIKGLFDITGIQVYRINCSRVVHLKKRYSQLGTKHGSHRSCIVCNRGLMDAVRFCSVECKVQDGSGSFAENGEVNTRYRSLHDVLFYSRRVRKKEPGLGRSLPNLQDTAQRSSCSHKEQAAVPPNKSQRRRKGRPVRAPFQ